MNELEGAALDAAVAKAEGLTLHGRWWRRPDGEDWCEVSYFNPSTRWAVGGLIVERERIALISCERQDEDTDRREMVWLASVGLESITAREFYPGPAKPGGIGPTPLVAAMRAFVSSKGQR